MKEVQKTERKKNHYFLRANNKSRNKYLPIWQTPYSFYKANLKYHCFVSLSCLKTLSHNLKRLL